VTISYKSIPSEKIAEAKRSALQNEAFNSETDAFQHEVELARVKAMPARTDGERDALDKTIASLENDVSTKRKRANAFVEAAGLTAEEVKRVRQNFLDQYRASVENNHLNLAAVMEVRQSVGDDVSTEEAQLAGMEEALKVIAKMSKSV
jgi:uncharacterized protein YnzC (UPF0291/DUF896 family)